MDVIAIDPSTSILWVPAGNTGSVDAIDTRTEALTRIEGFATKEMERNGRKRMVGPSSVAIGSGTVYVGDRADASVCAIDPRTMKRGACGKLDAMPDLVAYVPTTSEVWVSTPRDKSIRILDAKTLKQTAKLSFDGEPEGFAIDATRGRVYTNLEDADQTLAIDVASRRVVATWPSGCGAEGPHCLRLAESDGFLFLACSARTEALDVAHDGSVISSIDTGDGADDLDYAPSTRTLYIAAGKAAQLTTARVDAKGMLTIVSRTPTAQGARNGVADPAGKVYLTHSSDSELLVMSPLKP